MNSRTNTAYKFVLTEGYLVLAVRGTSEAQKFLKEKVFLFLEGHGYERLTLVKVMTLLQI